MPEFAGEAPVVDPMIGEVSAPTPSFRNIVLQKQQAWRDLKQEPFRDRSHALDIPERVSRNLLGLVIDNLPDYISDNVKERLRETHPDPIVSTGVLADKRLFDDQEAPDSPKLETPDLDDETAAKWAAGIGLLQEIAADTLSQDIITQLGKNEPWFAPAAAILRRFNGKAAYRRGVKGIKHAIGQDQFEGFRQNLVVAMLTGKLNILNEQLATYGYENLDQLAIELGNGINYGGKKMKVLRKIIPAERGIASLAYGAASREFPGVITLPLLHTGISGAALISLKQNYLENLGRVDLNRPLSSSIFLLLGGLASYYGVRQPLSIPNALVHETSHYLGHNIDHFGLIPIKYPNTVQPVNPPLKTI